MLFIVSFNGKYPLNLVQFYGKNQADHGNFDRMQCVAADWSLVECAIVERITNTLSPDPDFRESVKWHI
jgi:hypothetical protein